MWTIYVADLATTLHQILSDQPTPLPALEQELQSYHLHEAGLAQAIQTAYQHTPGREEFIHQVTQLLRETQQNQEVHP